MRYKIFWRVAMISPKLAWFLKDSFAPLLCSVFGHDEHNPFLSIIKCHYCDEWLNQDERIKLT